MLFPLLSSIILIVSFGTREPKIVAEWSLNLKERSITADFMSIIKEIGAIIIVLVGIFSLIGYLGFASTVMQDTSRLSQGDSSATSHLGNAVADEATGELQWEVGVAILNSNLFSFRTWFYRCDFEKMSIATRY